MPSSEATRQYEFNTTERSKVPNGRRGKHHAIVAAILDDLVNLQTGRALKIPLSKLPEGKVNVRSALNRATRKIGKEVATATDDNFLYVWNS